MTGPGYLAPAWSPDTKYIAATKTDSFGTDIVILDGSAVNVAPVIDAVGAVVCAADISNVRTVMVDGRVVKDTFVNSLTD